MQHRRGDFERLEQDEPLRENRGSRVYDEYLDLFRETEEMVPQDNHSETLAPLDVNFLGSLVRWTALAKSRVGEQELKGILDLYLGSGHSSPQLRELLTNVSKMVVSPQPDGIQAAQECIDLLSQLHGIFTGGLQIVQIPQDRMPE
ncbi:MAG: hypothetical protein BZY88_14960 [SAR202 cluster bacterium Io17-Chloro-G9]|nr:MAG: hypothetical protein BZY88_14960 [SAR202 cluster bacterium Io17-Chloro-G9]